MAKPAETKTTEDDASRGSKVPSLALQSAPPGRGKTPTEPKVSFICLGLGFCASIDTSIDHWLMSCLVLNMLLHLHFRLMIQMS